MSAAFVDVVVPLDGTPFGERAVPIAVALASALDLPLELVHVTDGEPLVDAEAYLTELAGTVQDLQVKTRVERGRPDEALAHLTDGSLVVCMATHGHGGLVGVALGSVADHLLRHVPATFVFVGPHASLPDDLAGGHVLLCFDGSPHARAVLPMVRSLATALGLDVHVAMVLHRHGEFLGDHDATHAKRDAQALVDELAADGVNASLDLLDGLEPARAIAHHAEVLPAAFVAAASHGSAGILEKVIGGTALRIVHHAPCPVVVRRPHA
jgi:nucleotide-binding universal stress UspA family protein